MRIRITKRLPEILGEMSLGSYRQGEVYDIPPALAEYLVMQGCAIIEMRDPERPPMPVPVERRQRVAGRQAGDASISS